MTDARMVLLCVKLIAAYSSMWNVRSRGHERDLSWLLTRCSLTCRDFQKAQEKIVSREEEGINALCPDWSVRGQIA